MTITICGGGSLSHVIATYIAAKGCHTVNILTRQPARWSRDLTIDDPNGRIFTASIHCITDKAQEVISGSDIVLLCVPGFGIHDVLATIAPHLSASSFLGSVVSSTGFFPTAFGVCSSSQPLFGFQRVPFIARIEEYGHSAHLLGYKSGINIAVERSTAEDAQRLRATLESLFDIPVSLLRNYYEASLTNSNPLLHPSRIYSMWKDWTPGTIYPTCPFFYADWTDEASELYIKMDNEFQNLLSKLPEKVEVIDVLTYYESRDAESLTRKLRSIKAFRNIKAPMINVEGDGYVPDLNSRYFTEDFPYGMASIVNVAREFSIPIPTIMSIYRWGIALCKR